jgi:hypothetical protein
VNIAMSYKTDENASVRDQTVAVARADVVRAVREVLMEEFGWVSLDGARLQPSDAELLGDYVYDLLVRRAPLPDSEATQSVQASRVWKVGELLGA